MLNRPLSPLSRILVGVMGRALGQRGGGHLPEFTQQGSRLHSWDFTAPDPNPQPSFLRSSQLEVSPGSTRAMGGVIYTYSAFQAQLLCLFSRGLRAYWKCERRPQLWDLEDGGKLCTLGRIPASLSLRFPIQEAPQAGQGLCRF